MQETKEERIPAKEVKHHGVIINPEELKKKTHRPEPETELSEEELLKLTLL